MPTPHEAAHAKALTQAEFRAWLDERPSSDLGHYELLNGRIVVSPPEHKFADDVLVAEAVKLEVHDVLQQEGHDGVPGPGGSPPMQAHHAGGATAKRKFDDLGVVEIRRLAEPLEQFRAAWHLSIDRRFHAGRPI